MKMSCENASGLVPSYLDGELSPEQSHALREHLLDCRDCRELAKEGKTFSRWFVDGDAARLVPDGFAARVARRAFAGDPGARDPAEVPAALPRRQHLTFLLRAVTAAAAVLLVLAIGIQRRGLPSGEDLRAQSLAPWERPGAQPAPDLPVERPALETPEEDDAEGQEASPPADPPEGPR